MYRTRLIKLNANLVKADETQGSRKISYHLGAEGTPYVVAAGIYDDKLTIAQLSKLSAKR